MNRAQQHAKELIDKFYDEGLANYGMETIARNIAERHALIHVDGLIRMADGFSSISNQITKYGSEKGGYTDSEHEYTFWINVKSEIEKIMGYAD